MTVNILVSHDEKLVFECDLTDFEPLPTVPASAEQSNVVSLIKVKDKVWTEGVIVITRNCLLRF